MEDTIINSKAITPQHRERNISIDILKFLAVLFITNSHMNYVYGDYGVLATGGAIGDVLFFFVSGFTLFLGRLGSFDKWYKRRIRRIYPSVFGWAIVAFLLGISTIKMGTILRGGGDFVSAIMIYYIILYLIRKYSQDKIVFSFIICSGVVLLCYIFLFPEKDDILMYKRFIRWPCYFLFMLFGAIIGLKVKQNNNTQTSGNIWINIAMLFISLISFYGIQYLGEKVTWLAHIQIITLIPLFGIVYYLYLICCSDILKRIYNNRVIQWIVLVIGGLCLEIYFVQMPMLIGKSLPFGGSREAIQYLFPFNIPILLGIIIITAYITRSVGRFFAQSFDSSDGYDWKQIFALK